MSYHVYLTVPEDQVEINDGFAIIDTRMIYNPLSKAVIDLFMEATTQKKVKMSICEVDDGE